MSTVTRPELSTRNRYWINRHRYYELKHFCLQYPMWKRAYASIDPMRPKQPYDSVFASIAGTNAISDPTLDCVARKMYYLERMQTVEYAAKETDPVLGGYILKAVTEGISYECLKAVTDIRAARKSIINFTGNSSGR